MSDSTGASIHVTYPTLGVGGLGDEYIMAIRESCSPTTPLVLRFGDQISELSGSAKTSALNMVKASAEMAQLFSKADNSTRIIGLSQKVELNVQARRIAAKFYTWYVTEDLQTLQTEGVEVVTNGGWMGEPSVAQVSVLPKDQGPAPTWTRDETGRMRWVVTERI